MTEITDVEHVDSYSTEAKANIRGRVTRMRALVQFIEENGTRLSKTKLIAIYCIKTGISKSTAYAYLEEYMEAEIVVQYGEHIMLMAQYTEKRSSDAKRLQELSEGI